MPAEPRFAPVKNPILPPEPPRGRIPPPPGVPVAALPPEPQPELGFGERIGQGISEFGTRIGEAVATPFREFALGALARGVPSLVGKAPELFQPPAPGISTFARGAGQAFAPPTLEEIEAMTPEEQAVRAALMFQPGFIGSVGKVPKVPKRAAQQAAKPLPGQAPLAEAVPPTVTELTAKEKRMAAQLQEDLAKAFGKPTARPAAPSAQAITQEGELVLPSILSPSVEAGAVAPPSVPARAIPPAPGRPAPPAEPPVKPPTATGAPSPGAEPEEFAANIRLSKYPEDLRSTIKQWADANPIEVQEARRGVRSDAQVLADAKTLTEEMGGDFGRLQRNWKPGEAWNAEEVTAIRGTLRTKTDDVVQAAQAARAVNSSENQTRLLVALEEQGRVQEIVHGVTAEAGRTLRAFRQEAFDAIKSNDARRMEELMRRLGGRAKMAEAAEDIAKLDLNNPVAVNNLLRNLMQPKALDYFTEFFYNSILSGPKTHIINALSNTITTTLSPVERALSASVEQGLARLQGRQVERFFAEVPADVFGAIQGIDEGVQSAIYVFKNGISPAQATKWEFRPRAFQGVSGRIINAPSTTLEAADVLNRSINYRAALNATIIRAAKVEGLKGKLLAERIAELKLSPTAPIMKEANRIAEYRLFRQEAGNVISHLMAFRDSFPPLRFVIPFLRTPTNLVKFGLERSPVGLMNPKLWRNIVGKNPEASDQIARIFLGSSIAAFFGWKFGLGELTGAVPTSAAERDRFYREGKQPFAVRIGNTWVQWQRIEPLNQTLSQLVAVTEAVQANDKSATEKASQAASSIGQNLVSQTYVSSLSNLIDALSQPERYANQFLTRQATAIIPFSSLLRTTAQITDPIIRKPRTIAGAMMATIPGLSQNVPAALTAFGQPAQRQSPPFSPILISPQKQDKVDAELGRLGVEVGFVGNTIAGIELTPEEKQQYQILAGQQSYTRLANLVDSPSYRRLTDSDKERAINSKVDDAREFARDKVMPPSLVKAKKDALLKKRTPAPARNIAEAAEPTQPQPSPTPAQRSIPPPPGRPMVPVGAR